MNLRFPREIAPDDPVGGKARALSALDDAGFRVPAWLVILPGDGVPEDFTAAMDRLGPGPYAVRSSAVDEDDAAASFAGQFDSFLSVPASGVWPKVLAVRKSAAGDRAGHYRASSGREAESEMAVIVQRMVPARAAGVAFSADPASGRRGVARVSAVAGLGERLVSGEAEGEEWAVRDAPERIGGPEVLAADDASRVAALARECERHFGRPQDIEWALDAEGMLWLLQSRPITTLAGLPDPDDTLRVWDNSNIAESYSGVTSPLTFSFARKAYAEVYRAFCRILNVPPDRVARADAVFEEMLGHARGRVYYNLLSWYRVLALLPGFALNRRFMEQMMGVREPLPEELVDRVAAESRVHPLADSLALVRTIAGVAWGQITLKRRIRAFHRRLEDALTDDDLTRLRGEELVARYRRLEARLLPHWDAPLVNDFLAMIAYGVLRGLAARWIGDAGRANHLVSRLGDIVSAEPAKRMKAIAAMIDEDCARRLTDDTLSWRRRLEALDRHPDARSAFDRYLHEFGDRCLEELKLESRNLRDDPAPLLAGIGALALSPRAETEAEPPEPAPDLPPLKRWIFGLATTWAVARVRDRENLRFERTRVFGRVRDLVREMGRRLATDGVLDDPEDVFFLEIEELLGSWEARRPGDDLRALARGRKELFAAYLGQPAPPDRFETRGPLCRNDLAAEAAGSSIEGDFVGTGASAGIIRGRARVVESPHGVTLAPDDILVARQTDPGWIVLFTAAAGLLVERGSLLSHSAIVSRELGLPCVIGLRGICASLRDGERIEMNGATGVVRRLDS